MVTDGFTGNVLLKAHRGRVRDGRWAAAPAVAPRGRRPCSASAGTVVVCHGARPADDVASGIALAAHLRRRGATDADLRRCSTGPHGTDRTTDTEVAA